MTAISITTNLVDFSEETSLTNWDATGGGGAGLSLETDYWVEGGNSVSKQVKAEKKGITYVGSTVDFNPRVTALRNKHLYIWLFTTTPGATDTRSAGGVQVNTNEQTGNGASWFVSGSDDPRLIRGGWRCYCIYPAGMDNYDAKSATGTKPVSSIGNFGGQATSFGGELSNLETVSGVNFGIDRIRTGNSITISGGGSPDPEVTLQDIVDTSTNTSNAWGIVDSLLGGMELQGELIFGIDDASSPTVMTGSNFLILMPDNNIAGPTIGLGRQYGLCIKTQPFLNGFRFQGSQTDCTFSNVTFDSQDTWNKGWFDSASATNTATVLFDGCSFKNTGDHEMAAGTAYVGCSFENGGEVNLGAGSASGCSFSSCQALIGSISNIDNCDFTAIDTTDDTYAHPVTGLWDFSSSDPTQWRDIGPGKRTGFYIETNTAVGTNSNQPGGSTYMVEPNLGTQVLQIATGSENWMVGKGDDNDHPFTIETWVYGHGQLALDVAINFTSSGAEWTNFQSWSWFVIGNGITDEAYPAAYFSDGGTLGGLNFNPGPWNADGQNHVAIARDELGNIGAWLNGVWCGSTTAGNVSNYWGRRPFFIGPGPGLSFTAENYRYEISQIRLSDRCIYPFSQGFTPTPVFSATGCAHAIICDDPAGSYTLDSCSFSGYGANGTNSAAIRFTATSGTINVNIIGGTIPTYTSDGATVVFTLSTTLTLTGIEPGSEVRVYEAGTTNEVAGVESTITGTEAFGVSVSSVDIVVHSLPELHKRIRNVDTSTDRNIPIQQFLDRQYENP
jgi:hypothetical protein